jgi:Protein of unknown function (DUF2934)
MTRAESARRALIGMAKPPPAQIISRLRQKAARARGHANLLVGDEAERRLKELADEIEQRAAILSAGDTPLTDEATSSRIDERSPVTMSDATETPTNDTKREHRIRELAYHLWEADGRPEGRDQHHWEQAEIQIAAEADATSE